MNYVKNVKNIGINLYLMKGIHEQNNLLFEYNIHTSYFYFY